MYTEEEWASEDENCESNTIIVKQHFYDLENDRKDRCRLPTEIREASTYATVEPVVNQKFKDMLRVDAPDRTTVDRV